MTHRSPAFAPEPTHEARRRRRQEQLYVLLQVLGWMGFLAINVFFARFFVPKAQQVSTFDLAVSSGRVVLLGWLLTHFARIPMRRWGWHRLGWVALVPRAIAMALVLSALWTAIGYGYQFGVLQESWPSEYPRGVLMALSFVNGSVLMLGWLCLYFCYHVFDRFNSSEIERLRLEASVKDAELRALKAQVNPHFMFNALNSVRALIDEDPARARRAVTQLANLLRYSLQSGALETVPFDDELQVVNDYLALEQVRHEERLRLRMDVAPEALLQPVPPMLLQTLVENAVKYGLSARPEGGEIGITARCVAGCLELRVTNPGRLAGLGSAHRVGGSTGLGLRNAAERLRLLFGEQASLSLTEDDGQVVATARLPRASVAVGGWSVRDRESPARRRREEVSS